MIDHLGPDEGYVAACEQIREILSKYRPDATSLKTGAVLSPRILSLFIERSEAQIPANVLRRLRPLAEVVLSVSEAGIAELVGSPVSADVQSKINDEAQAAYVAMAALHAEIMRGS